MTEKNEAADLPVGWEKGSKEGQGAEIARRRRALLESRERFAEVMNGTRPHPHGEVVESRDGFVRIRIVE